MKFWIGVTDNKWFEFLSARSPDEVKFWLPSGLGSFQAIPTDSLFLFKLHSPYNFVVGGGLFIRHSNVPLSLAWEAFGEKNGAASLDELRVRIEKFRAKKPQEHDPVIGCTILANPFFFERKDWIPAPPDWSSNIVQGKTYDTNEEVGKHVWIQVQERLRASHLQQTAVTSAMSVAAEDMPRYGAEFLTRARLGQGAFRVLG
jgi:putative restriction endonuclease